jgi:hypothetical protein
VLERSSAATEFQRQLRCARSTRMLDAEAIRAARQWRFTPDASARRRSRREHRPHFRSTNQSANLPICQSANGELTYARRFRR